MSRKTLPVPSIVEVCDWCDEPMDKYDIKDGMFHEPNKASIVSGYISRTTNDKTVNKFYFLWKRREERKPDIQYDFHSRCFDDMVKKALKLK